MFHSEFCESLSVLFTISHVCYRSVISSGCANQSSLITVEQLVGFAEQRSGSSSCPIAIINS